MKKLGILFLMLALLLANTTNIFAEANTTDLWDKPYNVYSVNIPNNVIEYAKNNFPIQLEAIKQNPGVYGLEQNYLNELYLGQGFNIFEVKNERLTAPSIYYFPVMHNKEIKAIYTIGIADDGSCFSTFGESFSKQMQNAIEMYGNNSPFIFISSDLNICIQNAKECYPIFVYNQSKISNLKKHLITRI